MTVDLQIEAKQELTTHPIFLSYSGKYEKHTRDNNQPLIQEENIWPILTGEKRLLEPARSTIEEILCT